MPHMSARKRILVHILLPSFSAYLFLAHACVCVPVSASASVSVPVPVPVALPMMRTFGLCRSFSGVQVEEVKWKLSEAEKRFSEVDEKYQHALREFV